MSRYRSAKFSGNQKSLELPIEFAIREFILAHERKGDSPRSVAEYRSYLIGGTGPRAESRPWRPLQRWSDENGLCSIQELDKARVNAYLDAVRELTTRSVYSKLCAILQRLLRYCVEEGFIDAIPVRIIVPKRYRAEIRVFTSEEVLRLRNVVVKENPRDFAIFMLLADTGLRASEVCNLRVDDFRWERQEVIIRPQIAKNKSFRVVPLTASIRALQRYRAIRGDDMEECDKFFLSFYATPVVANRKRRNRRNTGKLAFCNSGLTRVGLFFMVKKWGELARITESRCSPHTFRHYFATGYLREGGNIVALQRILGHSRLDITERYIKLASSDVKAEHLRFSPALRLLQKQKRG